MSDRPPPHWMAQQMVKELQATPAASGVYRRAAEQEDEEPTLPSARSPSWFAHPGELPVLPLWRVLFGMLLLGE